MAEVPALERLDVDPCLRPDELQFVARALDDVAPRLGADADPVEPRRRFDGAVGLDRDLEAFAMQRVDQRSVDLEQRLAARQHCEAPAGLSPQRRGGARDALGVGELAAALPVHADEIGVAELADRLFPVLLAAGPQVAAGEADEDRAPAGMDALALKRQEHFLDRVAHGVAA